MNFEIVLMYKNTESMIISYSYYIIPNVGDILSLSESKLFTVEQRLLPTTDSNRVVLFGSIK